MSEGTSWDKVKRYLPPDEEIDQALAQALKAEESRAEAGGTAPTLQTVRENTLVKGKVVGSQEDKVLIDIHHKADAVIPLAEFGDRAPPSGTEIEAWVMAMENADGQVVLSVREAQRRRIFEDVVAGSEKTVRGRISEAVKGGLVVDIGVRAFLPAKELELGFVEDLTPYVGREFDFRVIEVDRMQKRVILSRRVILAEERAKKREALFATLAPGQVVKGIVSNMTDFGAFVDIGGAEGLIHKGDLAWARVAHPSEVLKLGEEVQVQVLTFDRHSGKISLGLKQAGPSPWDSASIRYAVGNRMKGRVVGLLEFGAVMPDCRGVGLWRREPIAEEHVEADDSLSLYVGADTTYVRLGRGPFRDRLQKLRRVFDALVAREARAAYIYADNVRRPDRVTVRLREERELVAAH